MSQSKQEASATARASDAENSKYDIDPADTTRRVPHKRINNAYYVHQRWLEEQARKERAREEHKQRVMRGGRKQEDEEETNMTWGNAICSALFTALLAVIMGVLMGMFIHGDPLWGHRSKWINLRTYFPVRTLAMWDMLTNQPKQHIYTPEELAQYNGEKRRKPILVRGAAPYAVLTPSAGHQGHRVRRDQGRPQLRPRRRIPLLCRPRRVSCVCDRLLPNAPHARRARSQPS